MTSPIGRSQPLQPLRGGARGTAPLEAATADGVGMGTDSLRLSGGSRGGAPSSGGASNADEAEATYRKAHGNAYGQFKEMKGRHEEKLQPHRGRNPHADRAHALLQEIDAAYARGDMEAVQRLMGQYKDELGELTKDGIDFSKEMGEVDDAMKVAAQVQALQIAWETAKSPLNAMEEAEAEAEAEQQEAARIKNEQQVIERKQGRKLFERLTDKLQEIEQRLGK